MNQINNHHAQTKFSDNKDHLRNISMKINYLLEDLSNLKLGITKNNQELQERIYDKNTEIEESINENKELKKRDLIARMEFYHRKVLKNKLITIFI